MLLKVAITITINIFNIIWYPKFQFLSENRFGSNSGKTNKKTKKTNVVIHQKNDRRNTLFPSVFKWKLKGSKYSKNSAIKSPVNTAIIKFLKTGLGAGYFLISILNIQFLILIGTWYLTHVFYIYYLLLN